MKKVGRAFAQMALCVLVSVVASAQVTSEHSRSIDEYIGRAWSTLTRSMSDCRSFRDAKIAGNPVLYVPKAMPSAKLAEQLAHCNVMVRQLPVTIHSIGDVDVSAIDPPGLLYLPNPYVVPGGMFNEMYGWDSYFIVRGLLADGRPDLARGMVDNFFYEIENYGGVLNANRTYFLTRSQPPFLTSMIRVVYENGPIDRKWLEKAYRYAVRSHGLWARPEHRAGNTGLARYYDYGNGPVPEMAQDSSYYASVAQYSLINSEPYVSMPQAGRTDDRKTFVVRTCDASDRRICSHGVRIQLTDDYYKGDRAMRESGFDTSFRFGPYGGRTQYYAPVGLNALLYKSEQDLAWMATQLGLTNEAKEWSSQAESRLQNINKYLWNPTSGAYFDYDFKAGKQSNYVFATTFYPLWAGAANQKQAAGVEKVLRRLDQPGGIVTSETVSGAQWDAPYGWAPIQLIAVEGLERYGDRSDAMRIARRFDTMVNENFQRDGTIREKYNVETRSDEVKVNAGYSRNNIGFGWTNAAYAVFQKLLQKDAATMSSTAPAANGGR